MMDQVYLESEIEGLKSQFQSVREFSLKAAFRIFDPQQRGFLTINDFKDAVKDLST